MHYAQRQDTSRYTVDMSKSKILMKIRQYNGYTWAFPKFAKHEKLNQQPTTNHIQSISSYQVSTIIQPWVNT